MVINIPEWALWLIGVPVGVVALAFTVVGFMVFKNIGKFL